jgi:NAD(P)H-hydrate epimerase
MNRDALALFPLRQTSTIPSVTADEMREVDRLATQDATLDLLQMMENAGRALATIVRDYCPPNDDDGNDSSQGGNNAILILAGKGNNGGGALAAARHLRNWGYDPQVVLSAPPNSLGDGAAHQHHTLHKDGLRSLWAGSRDFDEQFPALLDDAAIVIDGLVGYNLREALRGDTAIMVEAILDRAPPVVVSLDVPTGIDATSGEIRSASVVATSTLTLALPKTGLLQGDATAAIGDLLLADIGIPNYIFERIGRTPPIDLFAASSIVRLVGPN